MNKIGILTLAFGEDYFCALAEHLSQSLSYFAPEMSKAIITDEKHVDRFKSFYDEVIVLDSSLGGGMRQKLYLYDYSPYDETIVMDADTLLLKSIDGLIEDFRKHGDFAVLGGKRVADGWRYRLEDAQRLLGIAWIAQFNGGCYYFKKSKVAESVVRMAQEFGREWETLSQKLKMESTEGKGVPLSEEAVISLSLSKQGIEPLDDYEVRRMVGPIQMSSGYFSWNLLKGDCVCSTPERKLYPYVGHFFWKSYEGFHYRRETYRLRAFLRWGRWGAFSSYGVCLILNMAYALLTVLYGLKGFLFSSSRSVRFMEMGLPLSFFGGGFWNRTSAWIRRRLS